VKGLDTNVLVRFLVGDDEQQGKQVYQILKKAEADKQELFIPLVVILELIWVLESVYEIKRQDIIDTLSELLLMPILKFEHQSALQYCIQSAPKNSYDLADFLIVHCATTGL
jgi:predicted nucleic-acid-binding protein